MLKDTKKFAYLLCPIFIYFFSSLSFWCVPIIEAQLSWLFSFFPLTSIDQIPTLAKHSVWINPDLCIYFDFVAKWKTVYCGQLPTGRTCEPFYSPLPNSPLYFIALTTALLGNIQSPFFEHFITREFYCMYSRINLML